MASFKICKEHEFKAMVGENLEEQQLKNYEKVRLIQYGEEKKSVAIVYVMIEFETESKQKKFEFAQELVQGLLHDESNKRILMEFGHLKMLKSRF